MPETMRKWRPGLEEINRVVRYRGVGVREGVEKIALRAGRTTKQKSG